MNFKSHYLIFAAATLVVFLASGPLSSSVRADSLTADSLTGVSLSGVQIAAAEKFKLFGTKERQSKKLKPFKKWRGAVKKMAKEQADIERFKKRFRVWVRFLDTLKDKSETHKLQAVNKFMNKSRYIVDKRNWGVKDYWASPGEFMSKFGDCEDYAIAKYMALKYLGFDIKKLRVVVVKDMNLKVGHAILAMYREDKILILDNQIKFVMKASKIRHYRPIYSINEKNWWKHS